MRPRLVIVPYRSRLGRREATSLDPTPVHPLRIRVLGCHRQVAQSPSAPHRQSAVCPGVAGGAPNGGGRPRLRGRILVHDDRRDASRLALLDSSPAARCDRQGSAMPSRSRPHTNAGAGRRSACGATAQLALFIATGRRRTRTHEWPASPAPSRAVAANLECDSAHSTIFLLANHNFQVARIRLLSQDRSRATNRPAGSLRCVNCSASVAIQPRR